jgi:NAD(P)-dependent dehydrogenase (short-subunit alcohol dehydrogenase family)
MPTALITGGSAGLGLALTRALSERGWQLIVDGRDAERLRTATAGLPGVTAITGDVTDADHRRALIQAVPRAGLDLLVNNASTLGQLPLPRLSTADLTELDQAYRTNVFAALRLVQLVLPALNRTRGTVLNVSSDAAREPYAGWGGYGSSKAALDQLTAVLAVEEPDLACYAFDPGDMRTDLQQAAFAGADISDRPGPETVAPAVLALLDTRPSSGRYRAAEFVTA